MNKFSAGLLLGAALILAGMLLTYAGYDALFLAAGGIAALATTIIRRWQRGDEPEKDERTDKIRAFSLAYSWFVSILAILVIFSAATMGMISIDAITALSAIVFIMSGSAIAFLVFLDRRGDVGRI
ncbi:MAG: hypothetical protein HPY61_09790 [Methanotrichaceae archaeon]|nr:hypothetical protein [Methanotrichaceae archaeon]